MLTEFTPLRTRRRTDSPWNRLPWTLPAAVLISAAVLWALAYFMERPTYEQMAPAPIEAQFIEQSGRSAAPRQSRPLPPARPQRTPKALSREEHVEQGQPIRKAEPTPETVAAAPAAVALEGARAVPGEGDAAANPFANSGIQAAHGKGTSGANSSANSDRSGSRGGKGASGGNLYASIGARAIIRPMPQIPDELREQAFNSAALARFHVAADGSAEVELARPTPNPRLNRILLNSLKKWRFMPAIRNGKPVATTEEIVIKIEVK